MKTVKRKRIVALGISALLMAGTAIGGFAALPVSAASGGNGYTVDLSKTFQEFDGWGLSLSWWATEIGDWTRIGSGGREKREEVIEAIYGKSGLNLNIARYNVGGGDDPAHTHMTDDRNTPGWRGATKGTFEDAEGNPFDAYAPDENYFFTAEDGSVLEWQETPDRRQLWTLDWIQKNRDDVLTEFYSNSPPYWMTKTHCTSGGVGAGSNLDPIYNQAFVDYLLDVYEYLTAQGFTFENLQPFNESGSYYWGENGDQEGCYFSPEQKVEILALLAKGIDERGLDVKYNFGDETNTQVALDQYAKAVGYVNGDVYGKDVVTGADRLTYHIYSRDLNEEQKLYRTAMQNGQELYMSEICFTTGTVYDPNAMSTGFEYTQSIIDTVKYGGVDAYVFWQGMEDMVGQMKSGTNYGLIQGVYYTQEEAESQGVDLASMGLNYQDFVCSKAYYMSGQYTKYIQKGYQIVDIDDDGSMAAVSPDGKTLVVVKQNRSDSAESFTLNLNGFHAESVEKIVTDGNRNWAKSRVSANGSSVSDSVTGSSVTTYVISGTRTAGKGYFLDDSRADVSYKTVDDITAALSDGGSEVEQFYATYDLDQWDKGKNGSYFGASYSGDEEYMAFRFKGTGFALTFPKKSDAGKVQIWIDSPAPAKGTPTAEVDLYSASTVNKSIVYSNKNLEDGWHTVYVKSTRGSKGNYVNFDGVFVYTSRDAEEADGALQITDVRAVGNAVKFSYEAEGLGGYEIYPEIFGADGAWTRGETACADGAGSAELAEGVARLRLVAVKDGSTVYSPERVVGSIGVATDGVLYYADCGTGSPETLSAGAVLGTLQSASDQPYSTDPFTGKDWGYTNTLRGKETGFYSPDEAMTSMMALENVNEAKLEYKFTIPVAGEYCVTLGFFGGEEGWKTRSELVTVNGQSTKVTVAESAYTHVLFTVTTAQADEEITVTVEKDGDTQASLLSAIVITESDTAIPLYAGGASNYNTKSSSVVGGAEVGNAMASAFETAEMTVYMSDGEEIALQADGEGVSYTLSTKEIVARGMTTATFLSESFAGLEIYVSYTWDQPGATVMYYNIDVAFVADDQTPPDDTAGNIGIYQSTTHDRVFGADGVKETSWGYVGDNFNGGVYWANDKENKWSIREETGSGKNGTITYKMTGFEPNEPLTLELAGHAGGGSWGKRSFTVKANGAEVGEMTLSGSNPNIYTFKNAVADENGELTVECVKKTGDNPLLGYIKVYSMGASDFKAPSVTADKPTVARDGKVTLRNLETEGTVYVLDENNRLLGDFKPTEKTAELNVSDYLPLASNELHIIQAVAGKTSASEELVIDIPGISFEYDEGWVREGEAVAVKLIPHALHGVTSLTVKTPDGVVNDVTDGFYYRAKQNGVYTATIVSNGTTASKTFTVDSVDKVELNESYSTREWTKDDVTVTFKPQSGSGIASVAIDGKPATANDKGEYTVKAEQNAEYKITVTTNAGFEYEKTVAVANIDKSEPVLDLNVDFSVSAGLSVEFGAASASGGTLYLSVDGGAAAPVNDLGELLLAKEGKYELYYENGAGAKTAKAVYYVTYGADKAKLASVSVGADGTVTVAEAQRAVPEAKLYRAGEATALSSLKAEKTGKYYLEITLNGEKEIVVFDIAPAGTQIIDTVNGGKSHKGIMIAGIVIGSVAIAAAVAVCTVFIVKGRKNYEEEQDD